MKNIVFIILLSFSIQSMGQQVDYKQFSTSFNNSNTKELFENASVFDSLIQNKRIILLGELNHGDGTSFEIKTKLIKYLHEKHGFNTLVFESGIVGCNEFWKSVKAKKNIAKAAKENIYYIWSQVEETQNLFEYIESEYKNNTPLTFVGMDPQFSGTRNELVFVNLLQEKLNTLQIEYDTIKFNAFVHELKVISKWLHYPKKEEHQIDETTFYKYLDYFEKKIIHQKTGATNERWTIYFENIKTLASIKWEKRKLGFEVRDAQMYKNLTNYLDENEKVIVWAANGHIVRNDRDLKGKDSDYGIIGLKKLGDHIYENFPNDTYSIAFSAKTGKTLNFLNKQKTIKIPRHKNNSFERLLKQLDSAFIDLNLFEKTIGINEYESQLFYPNVRCTSKWSNHFDGVIYIDKMKPSTPTW